MSEPERPVRYTKSGKVDKRDPEVAKKNLAKAREALNAARKKKKNLKIEVSEPILNEEKSLLSESEESEMDNVEYQVLLANALRKELGRINGSFPINLKKGMGKNKKQKALESDESRSEESTEEDAVPKPKRKRTTKQKKTAEIQEKKEPKKEEPVMTPWPSTFQRGPRFG